MSEEKHNIVIIGAGIIGCCTAYYITRHPAFSLKTHTLSILEASSPGSGASGKAGGLISRDWHHGPTVSLAKLSFQEHTNLAALHNGKEHWEYRRLDVYSVEAMRSSKTAAREIHVPSELAWLDQQGLHVKDVSKDGTVDDMAQVHPYKFTNTILSLAQERGAELINGLCTALNPASITYTSPSGSPITLSASTIIITTGPWTPTLLPQIQISTSRAHSIVIEPSVPLPAQAIFFSYRPSSHATEMHPELYSRPSSVYICGPTDSTRALPAYARDVATLDKQTSALEEFAREVSRGLEGGKVVAKQACYLPFHERGFPALGWVTKRREGRGGVFVAAGHGVWGISLGPGTGKVVAEMVLGGSIGRGEGWDVTRLAP